MFKFVLGADVDRSVTEAGLADRPPDLLIQFSREQFDAVVCVIGGWLMRVMNSRISAAFTRIELEEGLEKTDSWTLSL